MSKKMMLLALAAVSAAILAVPAVASANWGVDPGNATLTGTTGLGKLSAEGEPTITCEGPNHVTAKYDGSGTTGSLSVDFTACHIVIGGIFTFKCKTAGAPLANTILASGTFHNVTVKAAGTRGILVTANKTVVECEGAKKITVEGNLVGTVTKPTGECGALKTKTAEISFAAPGGVQEHKTIIGSTTEFGLTATTEEGTPVPGGEEASGTIESAEELTITCNNP